MKSGLAIYDVLSNDSDVSALVSTRIFPNVAKNGTTFPFIIYDVESESPTNDKDGVSTLDVDDVMVSVYSKTYSEASDLARKIRTALDRKSGSCGGIDVQSITYDGYNDLFDDNTSDEGVYRKALDFKIRIINTIETVWANTYSLEFDGVDDYLNLGDNNDFSFGDGSEDTAFSVSLWAKINEGSQTALFAKSASNKEYHVVTNFTDLLRIRLYDNSTGGYIQSQTDAAVSESGWKNYIFTYDGAGSQTGLNIYIDGSNVAQTKTFSGSYTAMENTATELRIGTSEQNSFYLDGNIDEFALFNIELSSIQATAIYNSGVPNDLAAHTGLEGLWRMGDPTGSGVYPTITDDSSNSNNGTMTNMSSGDITTSTP